MQAHHYDDSTTMRDARAQYFAENRFGEDGGYGATWVNLMLGPLPVSFPNSAERVRAVRYHDLHHIVTGYGTDNVGEFEIAAWEIAGGCRDFVVAWLLNLGGVAAGCLVAPVRTFRAFVRGRNSRTVYGEPLEPLVEATVGEVRARTGITAADSAAARATDGLLFFLTVVMGSVIGLLGLPLALAAAPVGFGMAALKRDS